MNGSLTSGARPAFRALSGLRALRNIPAPFALLALLAACDRSASLPAPGSAAYDEAVAEFYTGVAALQVGESDRSEQAHRRVVQLAPGEPAASANMALITFEQARLDEAAEWIDRARSQAPDHPRILMLAGLIDGAAGRLDAAIAHARRAAAASAAVPAATGADGAADGADPRARFLLAQLLESRAAAGDVDESRRVLDLLVDADSANMYLLIASARHAARHGDRAALERDVQRLEARAPHWSDRQRQQLAMVRASLARLEDAGTELTVLAATLEPLPAYELQRQAVALSTQQPDLVLTRFVRLPTPSPRPPPPDLGLRYDVRPIDTTPGAWLAAVPLWLGSDVAARIALLGTSGLWLRDRADGGQHIALAPPAGGAEADRVALAALDFDHDFRVDLALAGATGLRLMRQSDDGAFVDVTSAAIPRRVRDRAYTGAWAADVDVDGDMDLVLAPGGAPPFMLRNDGDGNFSEHDIFDAEIVDARAFVWGDLDNDGVPDAALLDAAGRLHVFINPRQDQPRFVRMDAPATLGPAAAITIADMDGDGSLDLIALRRDGALVRGRPSGDDWRTRELARWHDFTPPAEEVRLIVADLDNNGALDVVASAGGTTRLWLSDSDFALVPHETLELTVTAAADLAGSGWVELLGVDASGQPVRLTGRPTREYYALTLRPRAADQPGDRRINTFGIGGEAEVRAGMLYQKQPITAPVVHFGIGTHTGVNVARIIWPNGIAQAEFDLLATQGGEPVLAPQRLKGSCPWLFAFDGGDMRFVTDLIWRSAVGLRINAYGSSSIIHSEDWVRLRGDQLAPRDGFYELRITAELWESHFFDHVGLLVVDHPRDTEVFVDERFTLPPPELKLHATAPLRAVAGAWDDRGRDVTSLIASRDERYVDTFELGDYQGAAREHYLEVELGAAADADAPLLLVAHGWLYPTDGSINFALGQGSHAPPRGLSVEVPDGGGGWRVLHDDLGMPAGKTKTVLIDLDGAFDAATPRRVRLRTSMEIYWDHIAWTEASPGARLDVARVQPATAELRYRGFSRSPRAGRREPELPEYVVAGTAPVWRDLDGYHTRFGDVRPLLAETDDRYVIMNAGDELLLRFPAAPEPRDGWSRTYVLVADGWVKDGDFNNGFSSTLLPLPYHGMSDYTRPPGSLEDDPAYRLHPGDWREYHTRYISSTRFQHALSR